MKTRILPHRVVLHAVVMFGLPPLLTGLAAVIYLISMGLIPDPGIRSGHEIFTVRSVSLSFITTGAPASAVAALVLTLLALRRQSYGYLSAFVVGSLGILVSLKLEIMPFQFDAFSFQALAIAAFAGGVFVALSRAAIGLLPILPFNGKSPS